MEELISVIINVYNGEKFIKKCLDSVVNQTYKNLEILIINDGSTDNTLKICESYKDKRIKIINQNNKGLALSRNVGIKHSKGEYLYFVDSDDFIESDTIEYLYNLCKKNNTLISTSNVITIYDYDFIEKKCEEKISIISTKEMLKRILLRKSGAVETWNKLIKKKLFIDNLFEDRIINDMALTHKLIMKTDKIACSNVTKYYYLRHGENITSKEPSLERMMDEYNVSLERYSYIKNVYPDFVENDFALLQIIVKFYLKDKKELKEFLNNNEAIKLFKKVFSFKILKCDVNFREKIKIILFRINPTLNKKIIDIYLKIK